MSYYSDNREEISKRRREQYANDPEYREKHLARSRKYREENLEAIRRKDRERYSKRREKLLKNAKVYYAENSIAWRRRQLKADFNMTLAEYDEILEMQGGVCAICGKTPEENNQRLSVDHCHSTGEVRGLLCRDCNFLIGYAYDNPRITSGATKYLLSWS